MRWLPLFAIVLLLALPAAAKAAPWADVSTSRVATNGPMAASGTVAALSLDLFRAPGQAPQGLHLDAQSVDVLVDRVDSNHTVVAVQVAPATSQSTESFQAASFQPTASGNRLAFFLTGVPGHALPSATVTATSGDGAAAAESQVGERVYVDNAAHQRVVADTSQAIDWAAQGVQVTVTGDFLVSLWDVTLLDANSGRTIETGETWRGIVSDPTGTIHGVEETHQAQAYLTVSGGTLSFRMPAIDHGSLYLGGSAVEATSSFVLQDAQGSLHAPGGDILAHGDSLVLQGQLSALLSAEPKGRMHALVSGEPKGATLASRAIDLGASASPFGAGVWSAGLLIPAALGAGGWGLRQRAARSFRRFESAMEAQEYEAVAAMPKSLLASRFAPEAAVMRTMALLRLGRTEDAEATLAAWPRRAYPWDLDYLRAYVHSLRGEWVQANERLRACIEASPTMAEAVAANPVFAPLLRAETRPSTAREGYN